MPAHGSRTPSGLTRVIRYMQRPRTAGAAACTGFRCKLVVDLAKKSKKRGVLQYVVAHFGSLLAW